MVAGRRSEQGVAIWVLLALVFLVAILVWYAAVAALLLVWLLVWALGYLVVASQSGCRQKFELRCSRFAAQSPLL